MSLLVQGDIFDVPSAEATLFTLREANGFPKVLFFENLTSNTITIRLQESGDGGATFINLGATFDLGPAGGGAAVEVKKEDTTNIIRVRGSGGANDRDVLINTGRYYLTGATTWFPAE